MPAVYSLSRFLQLGILFIGLLAFEVETASAQVAAPEFRCVEGDTLVWEIPEIDCGELLGYVIYRSNMPDGPFEVMDTVLSPNTTLVEAPNPFGLNWYYFLSSLTDCPEEEELLYSDTLTNLPLQNVPITSLSVLEDGVLVEWKRSPDVEVSRYVIYRNTPDGTVPIDTVSDTLQYFDVGANAENRSEVYYVLGMNDCGSRSFFDQPHNTILLNYEVEECLQTVNLEWNEYMNWPGGISSHKLWVGSPGDSFYVSMNLDGGDLSVAFDSLVKDEEICFYVTAENTELDASSKSNTLCIVPDIVEPVRDLMIADFCADPDENTLDLRWYWNETAEIARFRIMLRSAGQPQFRQVHTETVNLPLNPVNVITLQLQAGDSPPYQIFLETTDLCEAIETSDTVETLHLDGQNVSETQNRLHWSFSGIEGVEFDQRIEKELVDGTVRDIPISGMAGNEYDDQLAVGDLNEGRICYRKYISGQVPLPNGETLTFNCESNEVCLTGEVRVYIPNAFRPEGVNAIFKPEFLFQDNIVKYKLQVFNRWGQLLFESRDPDHGWNGRVDGDLPDQGEFVYSLDFTAEDGSRVRESGSLLLVR